MAVDIGPEGVRVSALARFTSCCPTRSISVAGSSTKGRPKLAGDKGDHEVVDIPVPPIIELDIFEQVQRHLHARNPKVQAPRATTGPVLLTGLAVCATCRGGMTLRTGTSKNGRVYRYYTCSN